MDKKLQLLGTIRANIDSLYYFAKTDPDIFDQTVSEEFLEGIEGMTSDSCIEIEQRVDGQDDFVLQNVRANGW